MIDNIEWMKRVGLVFLGLIASAVFYFLVCILFEIVFEVLGPLLSDFTDNIGDAAAYFLVFIVVIPISFLFGSMITGYFSYYEIEDKRSLPLMAPALYVNLLLIGMAAVQFGLDAFMEVNPPGPGFVTGLLIFAAIGLLWYLTSWAGVVLGYYLRERFVRWYYGD
jgi:hypothetical protein